LRRFFETAGGSASLVFFFSQEHFLYKKQREMAAQQPSVNAKISRHDAALFLAEAGGDVKLAAEMAFKAVQSPSAFIAAMMASFSEAMGENLRWMEECPQREFTFSLVQTPSFDANETSFRVSAKTTSVSCEIATMQHDYSKRFLEIKRFVVHDWAVAADHLGRHLAEICLDLNNKICGITVDESRFMDPVYFCSCCENESMNGCWGFDYIVEHIVKEHPISPLVKSGGKT
jgi:hypothetical protein